MSPDLRFRRAVRTRSERNFDKLPLHRATARTPQVERFAAYSRMLGCSAALPCQNLAAKRITVRNVRREFRRTQALRMIAPATSRQRFRGATESREAGLTAERLPMEKLDRTTKHDYDGFK